MDNYIVKTGNYKRAFVSLESAIRYWNSVGTHSGFIPGDKIELESYHDGIMIRHANIAHFLGINQVYLNPKSTSIPTSHSNK